jgi:hypothetical protein
MRNTTLSLQLAGCARPARGPASAARAQRGDGIYPQWAEGTARPSFVPTATAKLKRHAHRRLGAPLNVKHPRLREVQPVLALRADNHHRARCAMESSSAAAPDTRLPPTMRAAVFGGVGIITVATVATPTLEAPTDAIVRVLVAGLCGSDLHPFHGNEPCEPGTVFGHEAVGAVVAVGAAVSKGWLGQRVPCPFTTACGECFSVSAVCPAAACTRSFWDGA